MLFLFFVLCKIQDPSHVKNYHKIIMVMMGDDDDDGGNATVLTVIFMIMVVMIGVVMMAMMTLMMTMRRREFSTYFPQKRIWHSCNVTSMTYRKLLMACVTREKWVYNSCKSLCNMPIWSRISGGNWLIKSDRIFRIKMVWALLLSRQNFLFYGNKLWITRFSSLRQYISLANIQSTPIWLITWIYKNTFHH